MIFGKHINRYYIKYLWMLLIGIAALVGVDAGQLKVPELYRMLVNGINTGMVETAEGTVPFTMDFLLDNICFPLLIVIAVVVLGRFLWRVCFYGAAVKTERDLRFRMFDHCKDLSQQYYHVNKVGSLMSLFTNDIETIQDCFGNGILTLCDCVILGCMAVVKMFRMNALLAALSMVPMVFLFFCATLLGKRMSAKWDERQETFSRLSDFSQESFSGIAVIKAFAKEYLELRAFNKLNRENEKVNVAFVRLETLMNIMITFFVESVICVILGLGGWYVHKGVFDAGQLMEFIGYFTAIVWPVMAVSILIDMRARGTASLKRVGELLDTPIDVADAPELTHAMAEGSLAETPRIGGSVEFRDLSFTYPCSDVEVLHHVSFKIEAGENVGIIGRTGSGKTTVVDLIARTYNVPDGTLFVDGCDVNKMTIKDLRSRLAYVPQDNFLFSEAIDKNIAFGSSISDEAVSRAAELADVHDNISEFQDRYKTVLGERGVTVSGGQKQRISIARALVKDAEIMILDDSVSAVDTKTEKTILENLRATRKGKTTLLIAHRITTVEHMDKIIFMQDGSVTAVGNHEQLLASCPAYAETVRLQRLEDEKKVQ